MRLNLFLLLASNCYSRLKQFWFNEKNGYVLQYDDLTLSWDEIPIDFHHKLNGRRKSLPKVKHITFGPNDTWWVSFQDDTAHWSSDIPAYISKRLMHTGCLVLDPMDEDNYFIFGDNDNFKWKVSEDFDDAMNDSGEDEDICYMNKNDVRYTQTSIKGMLIFTLHRWECVLMCSSL